MKNLKPLGYERLTDFIIMKSSFDSTQDKVEEP